MSTRTIMVQGKKGTLTIDVTDAFKGLALQCLSAKDHHWTVTHIPSGTIVWPNDTYPLISREKARIARKVLLGLTIPWSELKTHEDIVAASIQCYGSAQRLYLALVDGFILARH